MVSGDKVRSFWSQRSQGSKGINIKIWLGIKILFRSEIKINTYKNPDDLRLRREKK